jgi:hypothetical protein
MSGPSRFPKELNQYSGRNSLRFAPTPWPNLSGWCVWHDDFEKYAGWTLLADSTGTAGMPASVATIQTHNGFIEVVTANTDLDKSTLFLTPRVADTPPSIWGVASSTEWIMATAFNPATLAAQGFAIGAANAGSIDAAGTAQDLTTNTPTTAILVRKAVTGSTVEAVLYRSGLATATHTLTTTMTAGTGSTARMKVVLYYKNGTLRSYLNDTQIATTTGLTDLNASIAPCIQAKQSGTAAAQILRVDYLYFANRTSVFTGRV